MTNEPSAPLPPDMAAYLFARREAILNSWRTACEQDKNLQTVSSLSREEFNDMVPTLLNILGQRLSGENEEADPMQVASEHGLHRWHKGYSLQELLKEIGHLYECISGELRTYSELYSITDTQLMVRTYQRLVTVSEQTVRGSAARYYELDQTAAASRVDTLQAALDQINELTRQRTDFLRISSHDLRSSVGIAQGAAFMLDLDNQSPEDRSHLVDMLNRNLTTLGSMLQDLMSLTRLEAGQDVPEISEFDVAKLLNELIQSAQPLAVKQGLPLLASGPEQLIVESDPGKIYRIVQNLIVNALSYTPSGVVSVSWVEENKHLWSVSIQDSGLGLPDKLVTTLVGALKPTRDSSFVFDSRPIPELPGNESAEQRSKPNAIQAKGEGIGLHIVKRLCEILEASLDIETNPGKGTLIRVRFPIQYRRKEA